MKRMKNLCRVGTMCACLLFGVIFLPIISNAQELSVQVEPRMTYIQSYKVELTISNSGLASITGSVTGKLGVSSTSVEVTLQKYVSGDWVDVKTWTDSKDGIKTSIAETYQVARGTYRVTMICSANTETKTATSAERTY